MTNIFFQFIILPIHFLIKSATSSLYIYICIYIYIYIHIWYVYIDVDFKMHNASVGEEFLVANKVLFFSMGDFINISANVRITWHAEWVKNIATCVEHAGQHFINWESLWFSKRVHWFQMLRTKFFNRARVISYQYNHFISCC